MIPLLQREVEDTVREAREEENDAEAAEADEARRAWRLRLGKSFRAGKSFRGALSSFSLLGGSTAASFKSEPDARRHAHDKTIEEKAGWLSKVFVMWVLPVLRIGAKRRLELSDLGLPPAMDEPDRVSKRFAMEWEAEKRKPKPSLRRATARLVGYSVFVMCIFLSTVQAAVQIGTPFLSKYLIEVLSGMRVVSDAEKGVTVTALALMPLISSLAQTHVLLISRRATLHTFEALTATVFEKSLTVAPSNEWSIGEVTTILSNDVGVSMERSIQMLFTLILAPWQIAIVLYLLWTQLGAAVFAGVGIVIVFIPVALAVFAKIGKAQNAIMMRTDKRQRLVNELLTAVRIIKAYAWEGPLTENLGVARADEERAIRVHAYWFAVGLSAVFLQVPNILQIGVLWTYYGLGGNFSPSIIFPAIQLFQSLSTALSQLPNSLSQTMTLLVALKRVERFLLLPDLDKDAVKRTRAIAEPHEGKEEAMGFVRVSGPATFRWRSKPPTPEELEEERKAAKGRNGRRARARAAAKQQTNAKGAVHHAGSSTMEATTNGEIPPVLQNVSFEAHTGELVAVVGSVGSGKSSFLNALLGELVKEAGTVEICGKVSYSAQEPWIFSGTLRDNILFGAEFKEDRYWATIADCGLTQDLKLLRGGDNTVIGENGVTLSGGQRARVAIARAIYADSEVILLDDPLAAVDAHVADHLFTTFRASDLVRKRLVVLVTNQVWRLPRVDRILALGKNGLVLGCGTYEELAAKGVDFHNFVVEVENPEEDPAKRTGAAALPTPSPAVSVSLEKAQLMTEEEQKQASANTAALVAEAKATSTKDIREQADELFHEEFRPRGKGLSSFYLFAHAAGVGLTIFAMVTNIIYLVLPSGAQITIAQLTTNYVYCLSDQCRADTALYWMGWYTLCMAGSLLFCTIGAVAVAEMRYYSARAVHKRLLSKVVRATVQFFDATPLGRVTNRFAKDVAIVDNPLTQFFLWSLVTLGITCASIVSVSYSTKGVFVAFFVPIFIMFAKIYSYQRTSGNDLMRLEGTTRAPIYSLFAEVLRGRVTIRAYENQTARFQRIHIAQLRSYVVPYFLGRSVMSAWLMSSLNIAGTIATASVSYFVIYSGIVAPGDAGLALTSVSGIAATLYIFIFISQEFEINLLSIVRIEEFCDEMDEERPEEVPGKDPDLSHWPSKGAITVDRLRVGYRTGPDVLHEISFTVRPGEKLGVVGRTGSGKSTLMLALLRIVEARGGKIRIDGVDVGEIGLRALRSRIGIVPQEPTLFIGTLRHNLDPFHAHADPEIYDALEKVQMKDFVLAKPEKLDYLVEQNGENLSLGERQLVCVARALLRRTPILLLDEASASLDNASDEILQRMLRTVFKEYTTVTIAHRLETIADSTMVLVLDKGNVAEYAHPWELLAKQDGSGIFKGMVNKLDESTKQKVFEMAKDAYDATTTTTTTTSR